MARLRCSARMTIPGSPYRVIGFQMLEQRYQHGSPYRGIGFQMPEQCHEKNKLCANIDIGLDYDSLNKNKKDVGGKGKTTENEDVSAMLRKGKRKKFIWIVDSGCSRHMKGDISMISQFEEKVGPLVTFGDNSKGFTMGYGKLISRNIVVEDVALVAGLEVNLLSVSQFADKGFKVSFDKEECTFINKKTGEAALKRERKGSLFIVDLYSINKEGVCCFYTKASVEQNKSWHKKLSNLNFKEINTLVKKELVRDMPSLEFAQNEICEAC
ncbi:hypothetical protein AgCh_012377 [Apium graveolens]